MGNPFPGVNPFIEAEGYWEDFHDRLINAVSEALLASLPDAYDATLNARHYFLGGRIEVRIPDVGVERKRENSEHVEGLGIAPAATALLTAPMVKPSLVQVPNALEIREVWAEVRRREDQSLVTAIEFLSPTNKRGAGRKEYERKRRRYLKDSTHLVEVDLLRGGKPPAFVSPPPKHDYFVYVTRVDQLPDAYAYGWDVRDPVPAIPIPLRRPDPDCWIDLGKIYNETFTRGGYPRRLRYDKPLVGLTDTDVAWAKEMSFQKSSIQGK